MSKLTEWWHGQFTSQLRLDNGLASKYIKAMQKRHLPIDIDPTHFMICYVEGMNPDGTLNDNIPNQFNDLRMLVQFNSERQPVIKGIWEATTEPSRYWTIHPMNELGAARIKFGQYTSWSVGYHHSHEALVQVRPVTVFRDYNKDYKRDGDKEDTGLFGINQHWGYDLPHNDLSNSSAGCLVGRSTAGHKEFMALVKQDLRYKANRNFIFTATILPGTEIV